ncbi:hypothetical protein HUJ05_010695 [Dendroctonus ponderosae]|nr:hypothetical protein HUJ05_010695 [Dendroctonus ponderosae]
MDEFPNPDEEFELMYGDELDLLNEQDFEGPPGTKPLAAPAARRSLNFELPTSSQGNLNQSDHASVEASSSKTSHPPDLTISTPPPSARKRLADDLFGDISDLENLPAPKRLKAETNAQEDLDLIELILQKRNEYQKSHSTALTVSTASTKLLKNSERDKRNLSGSLPKFPFIKVKTFEGQSVYVRFHSEDFEKNDTERMLKTCSDTGVMGDGFQDIWSEAEKLLLKEKSLDPASSNNMNMPSSSEEQLWVDMYKPKKYLELLSDEGTNRTMLKWMKLWDKIVFNRHPKIKVRPQMEDGKKFFRFNELNTNLDEHGRPHFKVALLCGPPGLGKTTLAHMVAKHAGYHVVEVNASDDRSTEAFRTTLENATQMRSVVDQQKRPNCIVFDEIDGAPPASIDLLVKFVTGTAPLRAKKGKSKEKTQQILKRPIICICNDVYVPALRPLRQISFVVNFPQTSSARLAERLMEIARRQHVKTDVGTMVALAEKSNHDVRSCLSVLHFYKAQNKSIGLTDIYKSSVGAKDMQKGLFSVWSEIFEIKRTRKPSGGSHVQSAKERMQNILKMISLFGDQERLAQGVYENFGRAHQKDRCIEATSCGLDWFCFNDILTKQIYSDQNYSLTGYLNYAFVVWHFVFASTQKAKLSYPSAGYEFRVKETRQKAIIAEVLRGMAPSVRCYNSSQPLLLDLLPLMYRIITPPLRPVSLHLYTEKERCTLLKVASIMADYNLTYLQERKADGAYEFKLEPDIEDVVIFRKETGRKNRISYANRQLIGREVEMEKMRRLEAQIAKNSSEMPAKSRQEKQPTPKAAPSDRLPNHLRKLEFSVATRTSRSHKKRISVKTPFGMPIMRAIHHKEPILSSSQIPLAFAISSIIFHN